jgi:hypothetical protein
MAARRGDDAEPASDAKAAAEKPPATAGEDEPAAAAAEEAVPTGGALPARHADLLPGVHKAAVGRPEGDDAQALDPLLVEAPGGLMLNEQEDNPPAAEERPAGGRGLAAAVLSCGVGTYAATRLRGLREDVAGPPPGGRGGE